MVAICAQYTPSDSVGVSYIIVYILESIFWNQGRQCSKWIRGDLKVYGSSAWLH
jgi:hypothetical protein